MPRVEIRLVFEYPFIFGGDEIWVARKLFEKLLFYLAFRRKEFSK